MAGDGYIAIGGTTTNALMLRASAEYQNAAVLLIVQENNTVDVSTVVTYTFADGKKINGVKSIKIAGGPPYWTLGTFSMDSGQDLVFFTWSNNSVVTIKVINSFKTNFGCMTIPRKIGPKQCLKTVQAARTTQLRSQKTIFS